MLVSRNLLQSYPDLRGQSNNYYFASRQERNVYFSNQAIAAMQLCAVGGNPDSTDWDEAVWEVEQFNGENWAVIPMDTNFALVITNEGITALTDASLGQYKLEISRIAIKQSLFPSGTALANLTKADFFADYSDVCLDTNNILNSTFTLDNSLTYRTNLLNGGLQFTVELGLDCLGQESRAETSRIAPTLVVFDVATIGIFIKDQRSESNGEDVLFGIASLPAIVQKIATTPTRIGNSLKFYLNTTLSNMSNVTNLSVLKSSVNSVPEVAKDDDLIDTYDGISAPYNLYLVDNYGGTNIPALAVRKGSPINSTNPITWTYFTPTDDNVYLSDTTLIDQDLQNYMIAAWDPTSEKYIPADGSDPDQQIAGLYNNYYLCYAGKVNNLNTRYNYSYASNNNNAINYREGDTLLVSFDNPSNASQSQTFTIRVIGLENPESGKPNEFYVFPTSGNINIGSNNDFRSVSYRYIEPGRTLGSGLMFKFNAVEANSISWNFPTSWLSKPLYADYDHTNDPAWEAYCTAIDLDPTQEPRNRCGKLTIERTSMFVGWCVGNNAIKLALDLRNEATETTYGTTAYATNAEVNNVATNPVAKNTKSVTPETLQNNYLQTTIPGTTRTLNGNEGNSINNPIIVNTYTQFDKVIYGKGTSYSATGNLANVSFYGTAYRALWEDLAEYYRSDKVYPAGTLICIGSGHAEITEAKTECNGIISTKPGYELGEKKDGYDLPVALIGKVPVLFADDCTPAFGERIYLSKTMPGRASTTPNGKCLGKVIDKRDNLDQTHTVLCSVRIDF